MSYFFLAAITNNANHRPFRFTVYDFSRSTRHSYYGEPITVGTNSEDTDRTLAHHAQNMTGTQLATATVLERSLAGTPTFDTITKSEAHASRAQLGRQSVEQYSRQQRQHRQGPSS